MTNLSDTIEQLQAGRLIAEFDASTGALRDIAFRGGLIWRGVSVLLRDDQWRSVPVTVRTIVNRTSESAQVIEVDASFVDGHIQFDARYTITLRETGQIDFEFMGRAESTFLANRIGFHLLHPAAYAGDCIRQTRVDGTTIDGRFPNEIEPQIVGRYSIQELRCLAHRLRDGSWAKATFDGEVFETEDQRNWLDASFKTYCRPLALPFPFEVREGEHFQQSITLEVETNKSSSTASTLACQYEARSPHATATQKPASKSCFSNSDIVIRLENVGASHSTPEVGCVFAPDQPPLTHRGMAALRECRFDVLRVDVETGKPSWSEILRNAATLAEQLNVRLELALQLPPQSNDWTAIAESLRPHLNLLRRIAIYRVGKPATWKGDLDALRSELPECTSMVGGGSDANFCELNREHAIANFPVQDVSFVSWSINPQVHATDEKSIMETPRTLCSMVATAHSIAGVHPLVVSPITFRPRFNAVATGKTPTHLPVPPADKRQHSKFAAAWMLATWIELATSGVESATWFETHGPRGILLDSDHSNETEARVAFREIISPANGIRRINLENSPIIGAVVDGLPGRTLVLANTAPTTCSCLLETQQNEILGRIRLAGYRLEHLKL